MKILQVTTVAGMINAFLLPFANVFRAQGWQVDAAAEGVEHYTKVKEAHEHCFHINFSRNPFKIFQLLSSLYAIRNLIKKQRYDVVHVHSPIASFLTRLAMIGVKNVKVFYTAHGFHVIDSNPKWKNFIFYFAERLASYRTDHLFVMNNDDYKLALDKGLANKDTITFIRGIGINLDTYLFNGTLRDAVRGELGVSDDVLVVLQVAELNRNKNHKIVLESLALFKNKNPRLPFRYIVIGEGEQKEVLMKQAEGLGLSNFVDFLGRREDVSSWLSACDVLALSSYREGLPRCMLEAMCAERPIVASNIRGCRDLLATGAGLLVDYDDPIQWCDAFEKIYLNKHARTTMGAEGLKLVCEYYREDKVVDSVLKVYKNIILKDEKAF